jgi:hypothetical protein
MNYNNLTVESIAQYCAEKSGFKINKADLESQIQYLIDIEKTKQLTLTGVVKSLPSKNEITVKAWVEAKEHKLNNKKVDLKAYAFGFIDGAEYIKTDITK